MTVLFADYLLDQRGVDWASALTSWGWLLPSEFTIWFANRFADLFLVLSDGTVHILDVGLGTLTKVAKSRNDFVTNLTAEDRANQWLMIPLVDQAISAGIELSPGQCYGFKTPPVLGGEYDVENCGRLRVEDYLAACGSIHDQLRDVSDGSEVVLKVVDANFRSHSE